MESILRFNRLLILSVWAVTASCKTSNDSIPVETTIEQTCQYIGVWVTKDGYIRHELLPGNRYDEARGTRKSAYQGNYKVSGNHIDYKDDTGFTADGEFVDGVLYHAGMVLFKEN
ncbi:MAG TPA: Atu4866 domain-containing protein [Dyadobacter sp.]|jgi:hypothetical protein|nr:Atu4866 domain-containing protein [Dyadobacter sp.]